MKRIDLIPNLKRVTVLSALFAFTLTGCDILNNDEPEVAAMTAEDLELASELMAESLADQSEGLMADLNDMTARVDNQRLLYSGRQFWNNPGLRPCRGINRDYDRTYDPATGTFTIAYSRQHEAENCTKSVDVTLQYVFTDSLGGFVAEPIDQREEIAAIAFAGNRTGTAAYTYDSGDTRSATIDQDAQWNLAGLNGTDTVATLTGSQIKEGTFSRTMGDSLDVEGSYTLTMETVDVTISQMALADDTTGGDEDLETNVTGTISYHMSLTETINGETTLKETEGTIDLTGDGHALLRFLGLNPIYRVNLRDGQRERQNGEDRGGNKNDDSGRNAG
ncbi:MAG: hypothetical protein SH809_06045 [Rhodothermales bacterium]|nr:hypothetical protein [Rhodothermales bacterium]